MPDLFALLPPLGRTDHPLLTNRTIALMGVSAIIRDDEFYYFEVNRPRYWVAEEGAPIRVGIGGIGGSIKPGEDLLDCLRREVQEELGVRFRLETPERTALVHDWQVEDWLSLPHSRKHPVPYIVNLLPPRLGGPNQPDYVAIVTLLGRPRGIPQRRDIFGLLKIAHPALDDFFERDDWSLADLQGNAGFELDLERELPEQSVLRPALTAHAFQALVRSEAVGE